MTDAVDGNLERLGKTATVSNGNEYANFGENRMMGFGVVICLKTGAARRWYQKKGDVKRWADNDRPVDDDNV